MQLIPIKTRRIEAGDDLALLLNDEIEPDDILVVSSKVIATSEGRIVDLSTLTATEEAHALSKRCGRSEEFCQAVLEETALRNGRVAGTCPGAVLTELKPQGLEHGTIFTANAGLDESNVEAGFAVGWPEDPVESARKLRRALGDQIAVILSDSCLRPRRWGVTAHALTVSGINPLRDEAGRNDLFGKPLRITKEAVADQLATAANAIMGNADQGIPAVIIRDHGITLSDFEGWVPGIPPEEDVFANTFWHGVARASCA